MSTVTTPANIFSQHAAKLSGGWKCISFEIHSPSSSSSSENKPITIHKPHGDTPLGRAIITRNGYISAHMSTPSLIAAFQQAGTQWRQDASDADVAKVARGLGMYCGYLELYEGSPVEDENENQNNNGKSGGSGGGDGVSSGKGEEFWWATKCDVSIDPNRIGRLEKRKCRYFQDEDNGAEYMVLQPFGDGLTPNADHVKAVLKWVKFEKA